MTVFYGRRGENGRGGIGAVGPAQRTYGAEFGGADERREVQNALRMYPVVEQTEQIAHRAGQLLARADRHADGESGIDKVDPIIAAVSDLYDEPVLTAKVDDFDALGVHVRAY